VGRSCSLSRVQSYQIVASPWNATGMRTIGRPIDRGEKLGVIRVMV
jgi:hypothetical protein